MYISEQKEDHIEEAIIVYMRVIFFLGYSKPFRVSKICVDSLMIRNSAWAYGIMLAYVLLSPSPPLLSGMKSK